MLVIQIITYISVIVAISAIIIRAYRYATTPESFRWELYPVPHEKGKAQYGGSYFEELDWWTKPRRNDLLNELKEMMAEIIFLKGVRHHNKKVWSFSFPFHFGLYLCIGWLLLLLIGAILETAGIGTGAGAGIGGIVHYLTLITGYSGLILTGYGALGLFIWRTTDKNQRDYNAPAEYFNLLFFVVVIAVALINHIGSDIDFSSLRAYIGTLINFSPTPGHGFFFSLEVILASILIMYIPLSRMSHFVAKYFLYHDIRWNDEPNERGSKIEKRISESLGRKVSWSASHMNAGKTWGDAVQEKGDE
jgi:nitrate reductase gamma subunit